MSAVTAYSQNVRVQVLGPTALWVGDTRVAHGSPRVRALLAALALHTGQPTSIDQLVDLIWGERAPNAAALTLQGYVADLRSVIEPSRAARTPGNVIRTVGHSYVLDVPRQQVDSLAFYDAAHAALRRVSAFRLVFQVRSSEDREAVASQLELLSDAQALWGGAPYADLGDAHAAAVERSRLEELSVTLQERALAMRLSLGESDLAAAELEALSREHPLRERLWMLRALALYRVNRQADALVVLRGLRDTLVRDLGVEPSPEAQQLLHAILTHDPVLQAAAQGWTNADVEPPRRRRHDRETRGTSAMPTPPR